MINRIKRLVVVVLTGIISFFLLMILVSFINHKVQLLKEDEIVVPIGQLVEVNGYQMHVYTEGNGEETLVFMSGGGTSSPVLDFKSLYSLLSDRYRIVVIEKAGYGFSEVTDTDRDIEIILAETRDALFKAGIEGPFILFPHSMSGIEALYWAQAYPNEIKAIIGLDMATPTAYEHLNINMTLVRLGAFVANVGLTRWIPNLSESDAIKYGTLTDKEKELYRAIFYRRTSTKNMIGEVKKIKENARNIKEVEVQNIPMLLFSSNGQETGFDEKIWQEIQKDFVDRNDNRELIELDSPHYIHNIDYVRIAEKSEVFIESVNR